MNMDIDEFLNTLSHHDEYVKCIMLYVHNNEFSADNLAVYNVQVRLHRLRCAN